VSVARDHPLPAVGDLAERADLRLRRRLCFGRGGVPLRGAGARIAGADGVWALASAGAGILGAWFFVILAPTSSFVGGTRQMLAEHRMYLSLVALAVGVALLAKVVLARRGWVLWVALVVALGIVTLQRNADYRSAVSIYADTVAKRPGNAFAHKYLGQALLEAGQTGGGGEAFRAGAAVATRPTDGLQQSSWGPSQTWPNRGSDGECTSSGGTQPELR